MKGEFDEHATNESPKWNLLYDRDCRSVNDSDTVLLDDIDITEKCE